MTTRPTDTARSGYSVPQHGRESPLEMIFMNHLRTGRKLRSSSSAKSLVRLSELELTTHHYECWGHALPCGDFNVVPALIDAVVPRRWLGDAV